MNCKIIRSNRKSLGLEVNTDGLIIRAPLQASDAEINMFILQHKDWIEKNLNRAEERQKTVDSIQPLSMDEIKDLANKALKVIPERVKYVAIYARVSTEHEAQLSALENQIDWYKPILATRPDWTLVKQYIDEGITGTSAEKRPQFMKMIRDAKAHKFNMIITREVSRFARNTVDTLQYTRMLKEFGVEVFFINDNIKTFDGDGELRLTIMATLAQDESRKTSIRVKAGQQTSMDNGVVYGTGNILGYDRVGKEMVINPEQAKTVRMIFDMYLDGMGLKSIKYELESRGRLTAMGKTQWFESVISKVLRNSFYCGIMTYHKYYCPDYLKQNRVKNMGEIEMTYTKGTHEPIVTEEEFNLVQARMDARTRQLNNCPKGKRVAPKREPATIWGKLMKCSCGCKFNQRGWNHHNGADEMAFQCYSKLAHGSVTERKKRGLPTKDTCTTPIIPKWKMELIAHEIFTKHFTDISAVTELACKMIEEHINDVEDVEDNTEIIAQKNAEIEKLERKKVGLIEMRADGDIERDYFLMRKDEVEKQIECLRQEIQELTPIDTRQKKENLVERLEALKQKLSEYTDFENTLIIPDGVIEAFTEQIIASDKGFDWYLKAVPDMVKSFMDDTPDDETEKEWHELTQFDLTIEDAKAYVYSFSSRRRVHGWQNIKIRLFV